MRTIVNLIVIVTIMMPVVNASVNASQVALNTAQNSDMFEQMKKAGAFDKIKNNFIVTCYIKKQSQQPRSIELKALQTQYPKRVNVCSCFENELKNVPDQVIFDDSRKAYQLYQAKKQAMKNNDAQKLAQLKQQNAAYKPFISRIIQQCGLNNVF